MNATALHNKAWETLGKKKCERMHNTLIPKDYSVMREDA